MNLKMNHAIPQIIAVIILLLYFRNLVREGEKINLLLAEILDFIDLLSIVKYLVI